MVTIRKNNKTLVVTNGVFKESFESEGWELVKSSSQKDTQKHTEPDTENNEVIPNEPENGDSDESSDDNADLSEIPLTSMTIVQLRAYADQLGLEYDNSIGPKALRKLIRERLN